MSYHKFTGFYGTNTSQVTHPLSSTITFENEIDDILVVSVGIDAGSRTLNAWSGWNTIRDNNAGSIRHVIRWRRATAQNEAIPDAVLSAADSLTCDACVFVGCPTGSTPIGNTAYNSATATAVPIWNSVTTSAYSEVIFFGVMDADKMLTIGDKDLFYPPTDVGAQSSIAGSDYYIAGGATGIINGTASNVDGWQTATIEFVDDGNLRAPTVFTDKAGAAIDPADYLIDVDIRDVMHNTRLLEDRAQITCSFDAATGVDAGTDIITLSASLDVAAHTRVFKLNDNGNTAPTGLVHDSYYYINRLTDTTIQVKLCDAINILYSLGGVWTQTDITAVGSGNITFEETGICYYPMGTDNDYDRPGYNSNTEDNYFGSARQFTTPRDMTGEIMGFGKKSSHSKVIGKYVFIDSSGNWKSWQVLGGDVILVEKQGLIDVENSTKFDYEYGSFDVTDVEYILLMFSESRSTVYTGPPYIANPITVYGGDTVEGVSLESIYDKLNSQIIGTSQNPSDLQFIFLHSIQLGDGTNRLIFDESEKSIAFPPLADGITSFDAYLEELGVTHYLSADCDVAFNNSQIGASLPFTFGFNASSSTSASLDYAGTTLVKPTITLKSGMTYNAMLWVGGGAQIIHNDAIITNTIIDGHEHADGSLVLTTTHNMSDITFKNSEYGFEIDSPGDYEIVNFKYENMVEASINPTLASGTINLTIIGGDTPTLDSTWTDQGGGEWTKGSATVNFLFPPVEVRVTVKEDEDSDLIEDAYVWLVADVDGPLAPGTVILFSRTSALGIVEDLVFDYTGDQPVTGRARYGNISPIRKTGKIAGVITSSGFEATIFLKDDE